MQLVVGKRVHSFRAVVVVVVTRFYAVKTDSLIQQILLPFSVVPANYKGVHFILRVMQKILSLAGSKSIMPSIQPT